METDIQRAMTISPLENGYANVEVKSEVDEEGANSDLETDQAC